MPSTSCLPPLVGPEGGIQEASHPLSTSHAASGVDLNMLSEPSVHTLTEFLIIAKQLTYASGGSASAYAVTALLPSSHQLEFASGDLLYRDIYFGEAHFAGQEVVYLLANPVWSMCYAGGWTIALEPGEISLLAGLLQAALRGVPSDAPFRGPPILRQPPYIYKNTFHGDLARFQGTEEMVKDGAVVYRLAYMGGRLD